MKSFPIFEKEFHHDGRGPELQRVIWKRKGVSLHGFEYYNPEDEYVASNLKHLIIDGIEVHSMACEEVHANIQANSKSTAAIFKIKDSPWLKSFQPRHLEDCNHFQVMFYDEIYDIICKQLVFGNGSIQRQTKLNE